MLSVRGSSKAKNGDRSKNRSRLRRDRREANAGGGRRRGAGDSCWAPTERLGEAESARLCSATTRRLAWSNVVCSGVAFCSSRGAGWLAGGWCVVWVGGYCDVYGDVCGGWVVGGGGRVPAMLWCVGVGVGGRTNF
jgi:hypothetical protein